MTGYWHDTVAVCHWMRSECPVGTRFLTFNLLHPPYSLKLPSLEPQTLVASGEYITNVYCKQANRQNFHVWIAIVSMLHGNSQTTSYDRLLLSNSRAYLRGGLSWLYVSCICDTTAQGKLIIIMIIMTLTSFVQRHMVRECRHISVKQCRQEARQNDWQSVRGLRHVANHKFLAERTLLGQKTIWEWGQLPQLPWLRAWEGFFYSLCPAEHVSDHSRDVLLSRSWSNNLYQAAGISCCKPLRKHTMPVVNLVMTTWWSICCSVGCRLPWPP